MKLLIASNNAHKVREIEEILSDYFDEMVTLREAGLVIDVMEDGKTFRENAVKKAMETLEKSGFDAALADDSGLCVDALDGAPGVYSARYAGEGHDDTANNDLLMERMKAVPDEKRTCRFVSCIALARKGRPVLVAEGKAEGLLLRAPAGENGFGYDPYFFYPPFSKSFAELTAQEKNSVSHRRAALDALRKALDEENAGA
jgi:XTP/dITP diphosphohydrolase